MSNRLQVLFLTVSGAFAANDQWPLLMTHESSSYYFNHQDHGRQGWSSMQSAAYSVDQVVSISESLDLGVRAFDIRPHCDGRGKCILQHGTLQIRVELDKLFQEISDWRSADADTRKDELIVVFLQFDNTFTWRKALWGTNAGWRSNRGDAFNLARKRGWQIFSDASHDNDDSDSSWPCSIFSGLLRDDAWLNGTVVIDETCVNSQVDMTIHCDNGDLKLGMFSGWLYPLKCRTRHDDLLRGYMEKVTRAPEVHKDTPRFIQAHFQWLRLIRSEESRQVNKRIVTPWLNSNVDILKNQPIFIQVDNLTPNSANCLVAAVKRIQHAGYTSTKSRDIEAYVQASLEAQEECSTADSNTNIRVGNVSVTYDGVPAVVYGMMLLLVMIILCSCACLLRCILSRRKLEVRPLLVEEREASLL